VLFGIVDFHGHDGIIADGRTFSRNMLQPFVNSAWRLARILMRSNQINDLCVLLTLLQTHVNHTAE